MADNMNVEYLFNKLPYRLNGDRFDLGNIRAYTAHLQDKYKDFAERINSQSGYIEINLSDSDNMKGGIHFECFIKGISKELNDEIESELPSR